MNFGATDAETGSAAIAVKGRLAAVVEGAATSEAALKVALDEIGLARSTLDKILSIDRPASMGGSEKAIVRADAELASAFYPSGFEAAVCAIAGHCGPQVAVVTKGGAERTVLPIPFEEFSPDHLIRLAQDRAMPVCLGSGLALDFDFVRDAAEGPVDVFASPFSGSGSAVAGAVLAAAADAGMTVWQVASAYLGSSLTPAILSKDLETASLRSVPVNDPPAVAIEYLKAGKPVGWIQGRREVGPYARGNWGVLIPPAAADRPFPPDLPLTLVRQVDPDKTLPGIGACFVDSRPLPTPARADIRWSISARSTDNGLLSGIMRRVRLPWLLLAPVSGILAPLREGMCETVLALDQAVSTP